MQSSPRKNKLLLASLRIYPVIGSQLTVTPHDEYRSTILVTPQMVFGKDLNEQLRIFFYRGDKECKISFNSQNTDDIFSV